MQTKIFNRVNGNAYETRFKKGQRLRITGPKHLPFTMEVIVTRKTARSDRYANDNFTDMSTRIAAGKKTPAHLRANLNHYNEDKNGFTVTLATWKSGNVSSSSEVDVTVDMVRRGDAR